MVSVRAEAVGGPVGGDGAGCQINDEEAFLARMQAVVDDDQLAGVSAFAVMGFHRGDGALQKGRADQAVRIDRLGRGGDCQPENSQQEQGSEAEHAGGLLMGGDVAAGLGATACIAML
jgi:hypothetical protein